MDQESKPAKAISRRARRAFTDEFRAGAVRLVLDEGKTIPQVARDLDLTQSALRTWVEREYDFRRGGYATGLSDTASVAFPFQYSLEDGALLLENAGRLAFLPVDEARARELDGPLWLLELTIRPTGFTERPFSKVGAMKIIKAKIVGARVFTTENNNMLSVRSPARAQSDSPVFEATFDSSASPGHRTR